MSKSMNRIMGKRIMIIGICTALLCSCAGFRANETAVAGWPPAGAGGKNLSWTLQAVKEKKSGGTGYGSGGEAVNSKHQLALAKNFRKTVMDSGLFKSEQQGGKEADIFAAVTVKERNNGNVALLYLSYYFGIIPSRSEHVITVSTVFSDANGNVLTRTERSESVIVWIHLFMLPLMPFRSAQDEILAAAADIERTALVELGPKLRAATIPE